jgi:signal transduction histidine kinase
VSDGTGFPRAGSQRAVDSARQLILLVDDDEIDRLIGREYFEAIGLRVSELASGDDFVRRVAVIRPDLIVLDVMMPGIDGFEACCQIRSSPDLKHTPVLMATALDDEASIQRAFEVGATDFVTKPISWPLLGHRVKFILRMNDVEQELRAASRMADAANRAKSMFLTNMSHELRTPLNAILGFAELMNKEILGPLGDERYLQYSNDIHQSGKHLLELVNDLLDLSKVDAGMMELHENVVEVDGVVRGAIILVQDRAAKHDIRLHVSVPRSTPLIRADGLRLKQILINLLSNAVKFTPDNGDIYVVVERNREQGLDFIVRDTGIGMAAEDIAKIQEAFVQLDNPINKRYDGTGLGVPLAVAMAKLHGGEITYESHPGIGTTVRLKLPASLVLEEVYA